MNNIEDKSTFRKIPYKRSDEGTYQGSGDIYRGIWRELVGNVEHHPYDEIRDHFVEMYDTGDTAFIKIYLYLSGEIKRSSHHGWYSDDK